MLIEVNPDNPQERAVDKIAEIIKSGGVVAYPTDTMYGIGCNIMDKRAIEKILQIKQLKKNTALSFVCSGLKNISDYARVTNYAYKTMKRFLPGPYTFILKASKLVPKIMLTKRKTAGIRVPNNKICMAIVQRAGNPIISTSATARSGSTLSDPSLINDYFGKALDAVIDGGITRGEASSVVSLIGDEPKILRRGLGDVSIFES